MQNIQQRAAVLVLLKKINGQESVLLTKRAATLRLHSGEIALPGGKEDLTDSNLCTTALREAYEEVNANPCSIDVFQSLRSNVSRTNVLVKPFVGRLHHSDSIAPNYDEVAEVFWVPIDYLMEDRRLRTDVTCINNREYWAPAYHFGGHVIWGLTARILVDMLNQCFNANITKQGPLNPAGSSFAAQAIAAAKPKRHGVYRLNF